jgi:hypothetical protein
LVGNLVVTGLEIPATGGDKAQAPVFDFEPAAIEPDQTVAVGVRDAGFIEAKASGQH